MLLLNYLFILVFIAVFHEQLLSIYGRVVLKQVCPDLQGVYMYLGIFLMEILSK